MSTRDDAADDANRLTTDPTVREEGEHPALMPTLKAVICSALNSAPGIWLAEGEKYDEMAQDIAQDPYLRSITLHRY